MIKLKLTKDKFIAVINVVTIIIDVIEKKLHGMNRDMQFARIKSDLYELNELSRKMRSKFVMIENRSGDHTINFSVSETQAFIIVYYKEICKHPSYSMAILQEISDPIYKKLLE